MKVLINAMSSKMGGAKVLINSFIENIDKNDENEYFLMVYKGSISRELKNIKNNRVHISESLKGDMNHIKRFFWYQLILPRFIKKQRFDCMINFTNYGPIKPNCRHILLLHNPKHVSGEIRKNLNIKRKLKLIIDDFVLWLSLKGTDILVVQTNYMKEGILRRFKFERRRIAIIPSCPSEIDRSCFDAALETKLTDFLQNEENVFACITLFDWHKNLGRLIRAIRTLKEEHDFEIKLILTIDPKESKGARNFLKLIEELKLENQVISVGNIPHELIYQILDKSRAFILPSYGESFGIPFVEAMKFGLPIIASDLGFAHDVCGPAAAYFKYYDEKELADTILKLSKDSMLYERLKAESIKRSTLYDGNKIVKDYLELLV